MSLEAVAGMVSGQMREVSRTWCRLIRMDVTYDSPCVEPLPPGGLAAAGLPWPMSVARLSVGGAHATTLLVFLRISDAAIVASLFQGVLPTGGHGAAEMDSAMMEALNNAFDAFASATGRALRKEEGPVVRVRREFIRLAADVAELKGLPMLADCGFARVPLALGGWRMDLWEVVPPAPAPPTADSQAPKPASGGTTVRRRSVGKGKVLVADDTSSIRTIMKWILEREGYAVHEAVTGKEAVEKAAVLRPDVILLDIMMPEMDGFEACRQIRRLPGGGDMTVIMSTSKNKPQDVMEASQAGANGYLVKPFTHTTLIEKVRKAREKPQGGGG